ncbi:hypothetical protein [Micromonospora andamanensis]|nr:hypothetical protein [Micromonospora andamanensis]
MSAMPRCFAARFTHAARTPAAPRSGTADSVAMRDRSSPRR